MNKLENLKMVLFDFDDTLAVHSQGHRISDHLMKYMINVHSGSKELWNTSKPNLQLKKFMDYLACKNISMGLISGVHDCKAAERKIEWVKENYGYSLEYCCGKNKSNRSGMCFRGFCENCSDKAYYIRESVAKQCSICEIIKSVFFTREETETKLKEMEENQ